MDKRIYRLIMQTNTGCTNEYMGFACILKMDAQTNIWS